MTADQAAVADNFWMRAIPQIACSDNDSTDNIKGIVYYGDSASTPNTTAYDYTDSCDDEDTTNLVPVVQKTVDSAALSEVENVAVGQNSNNLFRCMYKLSVYRLPASPPLLCTALLRLVRRPESVFVDKSLFRVFEFYHHDCELDRSNSGSGPSQHHQL